MSPFGLLPAPGTCTTTGYREPQAKVAEASLGGEQPAEGTEAIRGSWTSARGANVAGRVR